MKYLLLNFLLTLVFLANIIVFSILFSVFIFFLFLEFFDLAWAITANWYMRTHGKNNCLWIIEDNTGLTQCPKLLSKSIWTEYIELKRDFIYLKSKVSGSNYIFLAALQPISLRSLMSQCQGLWTMVYTVSLCFL